MMIFFFNGATTRDIYTLSLHDALPILDVIGVRHADAGGRAADGLLVVAGRGQVVLPATSDNKRSEEHTSELQSHSDLVCRPLLEKKQTVFRQRHRACASTEKRANTTA